MSNNKSLKINALFNIIKTCIGLLMPLITFPYSSRVLGPDSIGKVNFAQSISTYFGLIAGLGITTYAVREGAKLRNDIVALSKFTKEILIINLTSTIIAYAFLIPTILFIPKLSDYKCLITLVSSAIFFTTIGMDWFFSSQEEFGYVTIRTIIFQIISIIGLFCLVKNSDDVYAYAFVQIIGSIGTSIWNLFILRKKLIWKTTEKLELKKHIKPILLLFSLSLITSIYTILDTTMLGFLSNDKEIGFYTAATKLNRMVLSAVTAGTAILLPRLSYNAEYDKDNFLPLFKKSLSMVFIFSIPATVGLSLLAEPIMLLLSGDQYIPAIPVTRILNPIIIVISISSLIGLQYFVPLNKEKLTIISVSIGAITNFLLNFILIPKYQAKGAAIATLVAESSVTFVQILFAGKKIWDKSVFINIIQIVLSTIIMSISISFLNTFFSNIFLKIFLNVISGVIIYFICLLILRNKLILSIINSLKQKFNKQR